MVRGYILMTLEPGKAIEVVTRIRDVPGVIQADAITGEYDAIAQVEAKDVRSIGGLIVNRIQAVGGVMRTVTCLSVE